METKREEQRKTGRSQSNYFISTIQKFTCKIYLSPEELILGPLPFSIQFLHHTLLISASVMADHFQDDTKALTQDDFLLPIFSFKYFDQ